MDMINRVTRMEDKLHAVKILEKNVNEMAQMFRHLSALIMAQGEKIDSIEKHVETAKRYVQ